MSTISLHNRVTENRITPLQEPMIERQNLGVSRYSYAGNEATVAEPGQFYRTKQPSFKEGEAQKNDFQIKRRLKGFLVELQGKEARVVFVEEGKKIPYDLPSEQLVRVGVKLRNQPFQMDEIEMPDGSGGWFVGYRFLALAKPSDAYIETLNFDDDRKRKRALILKEFGQAQD